MQVQAHPPENLIQFEPPLLVEGAPEAVRSSLATESKSGGGQVDEILNSILPPRMWTETGNTWMQYVSRAPVSRFDVITLQEALDQKIVQRQAREFGICPVREELFQQCFDELIRQVCINSPERGLLMMRIRDEIKMTIDAYKTLYESSVTFGVRKQLEAEQGMDELESKVSELEDIKSKLENQVLSLRNEVEVIDKREMERKALDEQRRKAEIEFLKHQGKNLDAFLKSMGGGK